MNIVYHLGTWIKFSPSCDYISCKERGQSITTTYFNEINYNLIFC